MQRMSIVLHIRGGGEPGFCLETVGFGEGAAPLFDAKRSHDWLEGRLKTIWSQHFPDVPMANAVSIRFVREGRRRLGWIAMSESGRSTLIGINHMLASPHVPQPLCDVTIAHELAHYAHGFGSPLERRFDDPHAGGVVESELRARGLGHWLDDADTWASQHWSAVTAPRAGRRRSAAVQPATLVASDIQAG